MPNVHLSHAVGNFIYPQVYILTKNLTELRVQKFTQRPLFTQVDPLIRFWHVIVTFWTTEVAFSKIDGNVRRKPTSLVMTAKFAC